MNLKSGRFSKSFIALYLSVVVFFALCVAFPLICVLFSADAADVKNVATQTVWHQAMRNTLLECICSTSASVIFGYIYAYAVVRGNIPFKKFFAVIPLIHLMTPPFVGGLAFILLIGRQGFITHTLLGLNISLYGFWGLLIAQTLCFFPMAYMICVQALEGINPEVEKAAKTLGAGKFKIFWTITLPLSFPGIAAAFLFVAVSVLSDFGNPLIVAGRYRVLAVEIYTQLTGWMNVGTSAVLGIILVIPSVVLFVLQNQLNKKHAVNLRSIGGKSSFAGSNSDEGVSAFAKALLFLFVLFIALCVLSQFAAIVAGSLQKLWGVNTQLTLNHLKAVKRYLPEIRNSVLFALISAFISTLIASVSAYIVHRTLAPGRKVIDVLSQLPAAIPGSLLGLAISIASSKCHFRISSVLIIVAMTVAFLPFSYRIISQNYNQISSSIDDAARTLGGNQVRLLFTVLIPLSKGGVFSGFVYDFIRGVGTLSAVIFLVSFKTPLASISIVNLAEQGDWGKSAALALVLTLITFGILALSFGVSKLFRGKKWVA